MKGAILAMHFIAVFITYIRRRPAIRVREAVAHKPPFEKPPADRMRGAPGIIAVPQARGSYSAFHCAEPILTALELRNDLATFNAYHWFKIQAPHDRGEIQIV